MPHTLQTIRKERESSITDDTISEIRQVLAHLPDQTLLRNLRPRPKYYTIMYVFHPEIYAQDEDSVPEEWKNYLEQKKGKERKVIRSETSSIFAVAIKGGFETLGDLRKSSRQQIRSRWQGSNQGLWPNLGDIRATELYNMTHDNSVEGVITPEQGKKSLE